MTTIFPIVEGDGDVAAVPLLIRRIGYELLGWTSLECLPAYRLPRSRLLSPSELGKALELARIRLSTRPYSVLRLLLMDSDDDCPKELREELFAVHGHALDTVPTSIVFVEREFEAWFLAADWAGVESQRLRGRLPGPIPSANAIRDAKGRFRSAFLKDGATYSESVDQPKFASLMPLDGLRERAPSFDKLVRDLAVIPRTP
jgi:hypothetical protein